MYGKKSIVAVDDSGIILKSLETLLSQRYDFHAFSKGMRALKYMKQEPPSLIILDIDMPEINGYEMLKRIREVDVLKYLPIIFLTSNYDKDHVVRAIKSGIDDYIVKPIDEDVLMKKIQTLMYDR